MDILLGIQTKDSVILVTSRSLARGISVLKADDNKVLAINKSTAMAFSGEPGDTTNFVEYVRANVQLYSLRNNIELSPHAVAAFTRQQLATSLRSRKPYQVNVLIAGWGPAESSPELHWIDYLGASVKLPYAAHGYASYYVLATLDRWWKNDLTLDEGLALVDKCVGELEKRIPIDFKGVDIHVVDKDGMRKLRNSDETAVEVQGQQMEVQATA